MIHALKVTLTVYILQCLLCNMVPASVLDLANLNPNNEWLTVTYLTGLGYLCFVSLDIIHYQVYLAEIHGPTYIHHNDYMDDGI